MMLADVTLSTEAIVIMTTLLSALAGVVTFLFKQLSAAKDKEAASALADKDKALAEKDKALAELAVSKDKELKELESVKKSYQEIGKEALKSAQDTANFHRAQQGKPPIIPLAPVITEADSPSKKSQRETADIATMRAALAQVKLMEDQPPRPEPPQAIEPDGATGASPNVIAATEATVAIAKDAAKQAKEG